MNEDRAVLNSTRQPAQTSADSVSESRAALQARVAALAACGALSLPQDRSHTASIAQWANWTNG